MTIAQQRIEESSIVARRFTDSEGQPGTVFKDSGNSHLTFAQGGAHITTQVPGIGLGQETADLLKRELRIDIPRCGF